MLTAGTGSCQMPSQDYAHRGNRLIPSTHTFPRILRFAAPVGPRLIRSIS
jgi:hypothetical protein